MATINSGNEQPKPGVLYIEMDEAMNEIGGFEKISRTRLKRVKDWRIEKIHWTQAFI